MKKPKVVAIGGGTGLYTLLRGLKEYDLDITAIVNMTDDGGSTGELRDEFGVLPPGDIRRCIVALSQSPERMKELFQYRFRKGAVKGHSFGNLFITALREITKSDEEAILEAAKMLNVRGKVLPVTLDDRRLEAELENGNIVKGETNIDIPKHNGNLRIKRLRLNKKAAANPKALEAIKQADLIILGPGDLFGSVISNLIVDGVSRAIKKSRAKTVYICNLMTKYGETHGFRVEDFVSEIENYLGRNVLNYIVFSHHRISKEARLAYAKQHAEPVNYDLEKIKKHSARFICAPLAAKGDLLRHDSKKIAKVIWALLQLDNTVKFVR